MGAGGQHQQQHHQHQHHQHQHHQHQQMMFMGGGSPQQMFTLPHAVSDFHMAQHPGDGEVAMPSPGGGSMILGEAVQLQQPVGMDSNAAAATGTPQQIWEQQPEGRDAELVIVGDWNNGLVSLQGGGNDVAAANTAAWAPTDVSLPAESQPAATAETPETGA
jgi:hypothetical protein